MYGEIMQAVKDLALQYASPYTTIENGALPENNGIAIAMATGAVTEQHLDRGSRQTVNLVLNAKHKDMQTAMSALSNIHMGLMRTKKYPKGSEWQITNIRSNPSPNYIERETSTKQWLYGSVLSVEFYVKGEVENAGQQ